MNTLEMVLGHHEARGISNDGKIHKLYWTYDNTRIVLTENDSTQTMTLEIGDQVINVGSEPQAVDIIKSHFQI